MKYFYSKEKDSFYPEEYKSLYLKNNTWSKDSVEVSEENFVKFSLDASPAGKKRHFQDGVFVWIDDILTEEQATYGEKLWRDYELKRCDIELNKVQDSDPKASGSVSDWRTYRKALRAWPENPNFPNKEFRPPSPDA